MGEKMKKTDIKSRRKFLKKAVYTAPVIVGLGVLSIPSNAKAASGNIVYNGGTTTDGSGQSQEGLGDLLFGGQG